jgi:DNA-binding XRE family transcriptional regulator
VTVEGQEGEGQGTTMSTKTWEQTVTDCPGAADRVSAIEEELRLAAGLAALREQAGLSQREMAERIGVSQPRVAAIERSRNVTVEVLEQYVLAAGAELEISVTKGGKRLLLLGARTARPLVAAVPSARKRTAK